MPSCRGKDSPTQPSSVPHTDDRLLEHRRDAFGRVNVTAQAVRALRRSAARARFEPLGETRARMATTAEALAWREHHDHLPVFHPRHLLHLRQGLHFAADALEHAHAKILMGHFTAAEAQCHLYLVAFPKE